jgi:hypothetical protein
MAKFMFKELIPTAVLTARLGSDATPAGRLTDADVGKFVVLAGESRYDLAAKDAIINGFVTSIETATMDGFAIGGVANEVGIYKEVTFRGSQAAGTGAIAIGDLVLAGTPVARGTKLTVPPDVVKATSQAAGLINWRVVSLGAAGTGAVGTTGLIQRVS